MSLRCGYANIGSPDQPVQLHYRAGGSGMPLVMLHASPLSAKTLLPMAEGLLAALGDELSVFALDTPGYGQSDDLPADLAGEGLEPYAQALERFRSAMGFRRIGVYGTATGAQIGVQYARSYPDRCAFLVADNAAHFSDEDREAITRGYFPDLTPDALGGHLTRVWSMARDQMLFFPWNDPTARLSHLGVNADFTHGFARQILEAGEHYAKAYQRAFRAERVELLQSLTVPATVMRWEGSIVKPYTDLFDDYELPANVAMQYCGPSPADRADGLIAAVKAQLESAVSEPDPGRGPAPAQAGRRHYLGTTHVRDCGSGPGLLILHPPGASGGTLGPLLDLLEAQYRCVVPDLPGHGASAPADSLVDACQRQFEQVVERLGETPGIVAVGESAALGAWLSDHNGAPLALLNPLPADPSPEAVPDLTPRASGAHWLEAWHWLRMRQMFAPWYEPVPSNALSGVPEFDATTLTNQLIAALACVDFKGTLHQLAALPAPATDTGRWLTLNQSPLGDAARKAYPHAPWQPLESFQQLTDQLEI